MEILKIFYSFAKVGIFGFGGGPSMLPLIQEEVVDVNRWMTVEEFTDALALGNALPGPIATKMAAYVGFKIAGILGAISGIIGVIFPSAVAMLVLVTVFFEIKDSPKTKSVLEAVRPVIVALMFMIVYEIFPKSVISWHTAAIALAAFVLVVFLNVHPLWTILGAGIIGFIFY